MRNGLIHFERAEMVVEALRAFDIEYRKKHNVGRDSEVNDEWANSSGEETASEVDFEEERDDEL